MIEEQPGLLTGNILILRRKIRRGLNSETRWHHPPKVKSNTAGKGAAPAALSSRSRGLPSRLRALADRLASGAPIPAP